MSSKQGEQQTGRRRRVPGLNRGLTKDGRCFHGNSQVVTWSGGVSGKSSEKLWKQSLAHVLDGSMSGGQQDRALMAESLRLNETAALGLQNRDLNGPDAELRVTHIVVLALALCILTVTGLYCISVCYQRTRQSKRAHVYESAVTRGELEDPVAVKGVKRSTSFINPLAFFRRPEAAKDNSRIYYIYSNPLPVGLKEEEEEERDKARSEQTAVSLPLSLEEYARDPNSGLVLDPPIFYMQL